MARRQVIDGFFVKKKFGRHHPRMSMEPLLNNAIGKEVCDGQKRHALMVGHVASHQFEFMAPLVMAADRIVGGFIEAICAEPSFV